MLEMVKGPATQLSRMNNLSYVVGVRRERPPFPSLTNNLGYFPASQPLGPIMETVYVRDKTEISRVFAFLLCVYLALSLTRTPSTLYPHPHPHSLPHTIAHFV